MSSLKKERLNSVGFYLKLSPHVVEQIMNICNTHATKELIKQVKRKREQSFEKWSKLGLGVNKINKLSKRLTYRLMKEYPCQSVAPDEFPQSQLIRWFTISPDCYFVPHMPSNGMQAWYDSQVDKTKPDIQIQKLYACLEYNLIMAQIQYEKNEYAVKLSNVVGSTPSPFSSKTSSMFTVIELSESVKPEVFLFKDIGWGKQYLFEQKNQH